MVIESYLCYCTKDAAQALWSLLSRRYGYRLLYGHSMVFSPDADEEDTLLASSGKKSIGHGFFAGKSKEVRQSCFVCAAHSNFHMLFCAELQVFLYMLKEGSAGMAFRPHYVPPDRRLVRMAYWKEKLNNLKSDLQNGKEPSWNLL